MYGDLVQLQVTLADPAEAAAQQTDRPADHGREHKADHHEPDPVHRSGLDGHGAVGDGGLARCDPAGPHTDRAAQAARAHAGVDGRAVHLQLEDARGDRARDGRRHDGGNPDLRVAHDVAHLQHARAESLTDQAAPAVFAEAQHGEAHHICAAAGHGRAAREPRERERRADGGRRDRQRERDAHDDRHEDAHDERLLLGRPHDERADPVGRLTDGRGHEHGQPDADEDRDDGRDEDIHLRLLAHGLAELGRDDRRHEHGQRAAGAAHGVGRIADRDEREQHHRRRVQRIADGHRHRRADHERCAPADRVADRGVALAEGEDDRVEKTDVELLTERVEDRADQQRAEQALCHRAERVDTVAPQRDLNILSLQKVPEPLHSAFLQKISMLYRCHDTCKAYYKVFLCTCQLN